MRNGSRWNVSSGCIDFSADFLFLVPVGTLLTVLRLLTGGAGAVGTGDIGLFLGLGLHLAVGILFLTATASAETDAILQDTLEIVFSTHIN